MTLLFTLGIGVEILQEWMALGRSFDWWDWACDNAGTMCGWGALVVVKDFFKRKEETSF